MLSLLLALNLVIDCPSGSTWSLSGATVSCIAGSTPPPTCPPGTHGTPPNCVTDPPPTCPPGTHGTPPNCVTDPPPSGNLANCGNQGFAVLGGGPIVFPWGQPGMLYHSSSYGSFGDGSWWVFQFSIPDTAPATQVLGQFNGGEDHSSNPTSRQAVMSTLPCDTRPLDYTGANGPLSVSNGTSVLITYGICTPSPFGGTACMSPGKTYYYSVRNWAAAWGRWSCGQPNCPMFVQVNPSQP